MADAVLDVGMVAALGAHFVGMQSVQVVELGYVPIAVFIKYKQKAAELLLTKAQFHPSQHLSKVVSLYHSPVVTVYHPKHSLRSHPQLLHAPSHHPHDF